MALSNIGREPQRELTESLVGVLLTGVVLFLFGWADWSFVIWHTGGVYNQEFWFCFIVIPPLMALGCIVLFWAGVGVLVLTHALGEWVCDLLEDAGLRLRPVNRPKGR